MRLKNYIEFALFILFSTLARSLPRPMALQLGAHLGGLARLLLPSRCRIVRSNLRRAFPEMIPQEIEQHLRAIFRHIGIGTMEMLRLDLMKSERDLQDLFDFQGLEHLDAAFSLKKGVFLLSGHIGFWEAGTFFLPGLGYPVDFVAKPMRNPLIDSFILRIRERGGGRCINSRQGARKIMRSLGENRGVAVLLDQHISPRQAVAVDFFGSRAYTTPIIAEMAMRYGVPVVPVFCYRTPENRYRVVIEPMVLLDNAADAVAAHTARLTQIIEAAVRREIDQWFWLHRRWR